MSAATRRAFLAFGLAAALPPFVAAAPAVAQTAADVAAMRRKFNVYFDLYRATHTLAASWQRYIRNVDPQNGPTGRESRINGLMAPPPATAELAAAERMVPAAPALTEPDRAARTLVAFYREAIAPMTEAAAFFATYDPRTDGGREGQVWHRRLRSTVAFAEDARPDLYRALDAMRGEMEPRELALLAARGKGPAWHARHASLSARAVRDAFPRAPGAFDPKTLNERIEAFGAAAALVQAYEAANPGALMMFSGVPASFMTAATRLAGQIAARPDPANATAADLAAINAAYEQIAQMADLLVVSMG